MPLNNFTQTSFQNKKSGIQITGLEMSLDQEIKLNEIFLYECLI